MTIKLCFFILLLSLLNYALITTAVDIVLMGVLHFRFSPRCRKKSFVIEKPNRIDIQDGYKCSAFSSAYILRHWNIDADGSSLYEVMPHKMKSGYVYPKGILALLLQRGFTVKLCAGNINALKNEISSGNPVIVLIKVRPDKNWLHYVPVVGYDENTIFIAESLAELVNCDENRYNQKVGTADFKKLWNTCALKMPLYKNIFITVRK